MLLNYSVKTIVGHYHRDNTDVLQSMVLQLIYLQTGIV